MKSICPKGRLPNFWGYRYQPLLPGRKPGKFHFTSMAGKSCSRNPKFWKPWRIPFYNSLPNQSSINPNHSTILNQSIYVYHRKFQSNSPAFKQNERIPWCGNKNSSSAFGSAASRWFWLGLEWLEYICCEFGCLIFIIRIGMINSHFLDICIDQLVQHLCHGSQ